MVVNSVLLLGVNTFCLIFTKKITAFLVSCKVFPLTDFFFVNLCYFIRKLLLCRLTKSANNIAGLQLCKSFPNCGRWYVTYAIIYPSRWCATWWWDICLNILPITYILPQCVLALSNPLNRFDFTALLGGRSVSIDGHLCQNSTEINAKPDVYETTMCRIRSIASALMHN